MIWLSFKTPEQVSYGIDLYTGPLEVTPSRSVQSTHAPSNPEQSPCAISCTVFYKSIPAALRCLISILSVNQDTAVHAWQWTQS